MRWLIGTFFLAAFGAVAGATEEGANVLYDALTTDGVELSDGTLIALPLSSLTDDASPEHQQQTLKEVAGKFPYDQFVRDSRTARFRIDLKSVKNNSGDRTGQTVDVWFVAYGTLQAIEENELLDELGKWNREKAGQQDKDLDRPLSEDELAEREITTATDEDELVERYGYFDAPLLNKVQVIGVTRSVLTRGEKSTLWAIVLDDRFVDDQEFPNQWRSLKRNELGKMEMGPAQSYSGFGGYVKVNELVAPEGALLVEMHIAFDEPQGWFGGANLLRTKLPLAIQENVRTFRKRLKDVSKTVE